MSFRNMIQPIFLIIMASFYLFAVYKDHMIYTSNAVFKATGLNHHNTFGGRLKFLTYIDTNLQAIYFTICALNVIIKFVTGKKSSAVERFCNGMYTSIIFPIGAIVSILFWGVYAVDRNLIYPKVIELAIPSYQNHLVHTLPLFGALLDSAVTHHHYNKSFFKGVLGTVLFMLAYLIWIFIVAHVGGFWVYPVLQVLSPLKRGYFIVGSGVLGAILYKSGEVINKLFWTNGQQNKTKKLN